MRPLSYLNKVIIVAATAAVLFIQQSSVVLAGKPGYPDRVTWGGLSWQVKTSQTAVGKRRASAAPGLLETGWKERCSKQAGYL